MLFRRYDVIAALLFFVTALIWSQNIPLFEAPDEYSHVKYAEFLANHGRQPTRAEVRSQPELWESFQPPLYYLALAGLIRLGVATTGIQAADNSDYSPNPSLRSMNRYDAEAICANNSPAAVAGVYRLRILNALFGAVFVWVCFQLMRVYSIEYLGAQLVAFWISIPAFIFSAATISNDIPAAMFCAIGLFWYARYCKAESIGAAISSGVFFGLALMTKTTALFLWAPLLILEFLRTPRFVFTQARLAQLLLPIVVAGYWVVSSLLVHPTADPDPIRIALINSHPLSNAFVWVLTLARAIYTTLATSIGVLGTQVVWLPAVVYGAYGAVLLIFLLAAWPNYCRTGFRQSTAHESRTLLLAGSFATSLLLAASVVRFRETGEAMHARLLLGYVPCFLVGIVGAAQRDTYALHTSGRLTRRIALGTALACLTGLLLPKAVFVSVVGGVARLLRLQHSVAHYAEVVVIFLATILFLSLVTAYQQRLLNWLSVSAGALEKRVVWLSATGLALSIGLLFFHVLPLLGS